MPAAAVPRAEQRPCRGGGLGPPGLAPGQPPAPVSAPPELALRPRRGRLEVRGWGVVILPSDTQLLEQLWLGGRLEGREEESSSPPGPGAHSSGVLGITSLLSQLPRQACGGGVPLPSPFPQTRPLRAPVMADSIPSRPLDPRAHLPGQPPPATTGLREFKAVARS